MESDKNNKITIRGARVHNLKNVNLDIPRDKLVVITGLSGSGKSSLAFDTIYAEGQRRYIESLSSYARQFLGVMDKPDVDKIEGLSPAISIDQKSVSRNPRSTVGTVTEIYDYLRLLFARVGKPHCPECGRPVSKQSPSQIADKIAKWERGTEFMILAPVVRGKKGEHRALIQEIANAGYLRLRVNGEVMAAGEASEMKFDRYKIHHIETVIDRMIVEKGLDRTRLVSSIETALKMGKGLMIISKKTAGKAAGEAKNNFEDVLFSEMFSCPDCGINLPEIEPRLFSFNSPYGACSECTGLGSKLEVDPSLVVPNLNLTIAEGAIKPWSGISGQGWHFWELQKLAENRGFSLNVSFKNLPEKIKDLIIFGERSEDLSLLKGESPLGRATSKSGESGFEGVAANLERRWKETDSDWARNEMEKYMVVKKCPKCLGRRLHKEALAVTISKENIVEISGRSISGCRKFFENILASAEFSKSEKKIAEPIIKEIIGRLKFLLDVGLDYLTLERESTTLSGGEAQRIRLATQIGSRLVGVLYILDEPSIGLHPRDHQKLIATLKYLRDLGNSVLVVEHDAQTILAADWVVDLGPGAGKYGGEIIFEGTVKQLAKANTPTADYLFGRKTIMDKGGKIRSVKSDLPADRHDLPAKVSAQAGIRNNVKIQNSNTQNFLEIKGAAENNLKNINVKIPFGKLVCVSGVSGSGKSSLVYDILAKFLLTKFHHARLIPGKHEKINGAENLNKAIVIDQSPIGRTPRSNPATYTGVFAAIRDIFVKTKESKMRGYGPGRFSFNVKGGRCEACEGQGVKKIEMYFLPDVYVECEECHGRRYNKEVLEIEYKDKNIADVLKMPVVEALKFFENIPAIKQKLQTLNEVGLGYIELGQPATTLSGGEAQRIKLAAELSRRGTGKTLYILDEPTTGLHFDDIKKLLKVLIALVEKENTVLVIEHNLDVVKNADWVIDLGPEGGDKGGYIVAEGTPEEIAKNKKSHTGKFLKLLSL